MKINWVGYKFISQDGYGRYGVNMVRALARRGVKVNPMLAQTLYDLPDDLLRMAQVDVSDLSIFLLPPIAVKDYVPPRAWIYTMHEDSKLPASWVATINRFERCIVPCEHNKQVFTESGVTIPINIVHGGTNPDEFPVVPTLYPERPYTFMALADRGIRKGWDIVWEAWLKYFKDVPDVRLIIKARPGMTPSWFTQEAFKDERITLWVEDTVDMRQVFERADCIVYPARCDGWGMWWREAAMMGIPALVTNYSGNAVGVHEAAVALEKYRMIVSALDYSEGEWAQPDMDEVGEKMRWAYENKGAARAKGRIAAEWLRENQTWDHSARQLIQLIEAYA